MGWEPRTLLVKLIRPHDKTTEPVVLSYPTSIDQPKSVSLSNRPIPREDLRVCWQLILQHSTSENGPNPRTYTDQEDREKTIGRFEQEHFYEAFDDFMQQQIVIEDQIAALITQRNDDVLRLKTLQNSSWAGFYCL